MSDRWATFDCYGTLVDWLGGIRTQLAAAVARRATPTRCCAATTRSSPQVQEGRGIPYRQVMAETLATGREAEGLRASPMASRTRWPSSLPDVARLPRRARRAHRAPRTADGSSRSCRTPTPTCWTRRSPRSACRSTCASWRRTSARTSRRSGIGRRSSARRAPIGRATCTWRRRSSTTSSRAPKLGLPVRVDQPAGRDQHGAAFGGAARSHAACPTRSKGWFRPRLRPWTGRHVPSPRAKISTPS